MDIRDISSSQLKEFLVSQNEKSFREKQINEWLWKKNVTSFEEMINLPKSLQEKLNQHFTFQKSKIETEIVSPDKTVKFIFHLFDGEQIEGVLIPSNGRVTVCVSSQVGCALGCTFCATGTMGFTRHLHFWEIIDQYALMNRRALELFEIPISNIVFMGMGEPLLNYDNVLKSIVILTSPNGNALSPSRITLSTVGICEGIIKLANDGYKANLAISLHVAHDPKRTRLIPINQTNNLKKLQNALRYFVSKTNQRITIEYVLLRNENDSLEDAENLCQFCRAFPVKINIIEYNTTDFNYQPSLPEKKEDFVNYLESKNLVVNVRQSRGKDIAAACGQLVSKSKKLLFFLLVFFLSNQIFGQFYNGSQLSFGKSRVQYQNFNWQYYRNTQFDVYFYANSRPIADYVSVVAPSIIAEVEKYLNFTSSKKLQFIVYRTQSDFKESNFNYDNDDFYNQAGITNIYGSKVYLYFDGSHPNLDKMIRGGIASVYANGIMNGQTARANMAAEYSMDEPNWFYSGLSSYIADNWNSEVEAFVKDGILAKRYKHLDDLTTKEATLAGHSFWHFFVDRYGETAISSALYACRSARSVPRGLQNITKQSFKDLTKDWYRFYVVSFSKDKDREKQESEPVVQKPKKLRNYSNLTLSPDGESFAYVTNEAGQIKVWLKTPDLKKPKVVFSKYAKTEDNPDFTFPKIAWHQNGEIFGFTTEDKGRTKGIKTVQSYYYPVVVKTKKREQRSLIEVDKIVDWKYSPDGRSLLFSAAKNGQSDIYLLHLQSQSLQNLTQDVYDDLEPQFLNDGTSIIFSSNRPDDSLSNKRFYDKESIHTFDLFVYQANKPEASLWRVTETPDWNERNSLVMENGEVLFLSDENGINNRYVAKFDSTITKIDTIVHYAHFARTEPLTDYINALFEHDYRPETKQLAQINYYKGAQRMYIFSYEELVKLPKLVPSFFLQKSQLEAEKKDSIAKATPLIVSKSGKKKGLRQMYRSDITPKATVQIADSTSKLNQIYGWQPNMATDGAEYKQQVARNYEMQFTVNKMITQADFSFLNTTYQQFTGGQSPIYLNTGLNALIMVGINDLFENYRITGGFRLSFDLASNEVMLSYEYLKRRLDQQVVFYRQSIQEFVGYGVVKQHSNSAYYILKYPLNRYNALHFTFNGRYEDFVIGAVDDRTLREKTEHQVWAGFKVSYIFDSSKELYTNLWRGSKIKVWAEYNQRLATYKEKLKYGEVNLFVLGFDIRKSVKVFRNMTWATRLAGSTNFGTARLVYYMGGMDNWIWAKFNSDNWTDQTKNYVYQSLATNMRGFEQNVRNGTSFLLLSTELRVPFVQLIAGRKLSSNILNSMQFLVFGEIGTAWTGTTPYSRDNCLYSRWIESGNIKVKVNRQVDPWVQGIGLGYRISLFGYFIRLDYAWGIENMKIENKNGQLMFSLGLDF